MKRKHHQLAETVYDLRRRLVQVWLPHLEQREADLVRGLEAQQPRNKAPDGVPTGAPGNEATDALPVSPPPMAAPPSGAISPPTGQG